tara:strand:+ start:10467 stop:10847 length:381 start_codon:yes stop_codon:yes gene_type:complete
VKNRTDLGVVFACKFQKKQIQYAFVTTSGVYRMVSELFDNKHDLSRITQMRNQPKDIERFLQGQPAFQFYSNEFKHLPGVSDFMKNGQFDKAALEKVERLTPASSMVLEYLAMLPIDSINITEKAA